MENEEIFRAFTRPLNPLPTGARPRGSARLPLRAALFDIYGTLFISASGDIGSAGDNPRVSAPLEDLLGRHRIFLPLPELLAAYREAVAAQHRERQAQGIRFPEVDILGIWSDLLPQIPPDALRGFALAFELITNPVYPMPDLAALLRAARGAGLKMGLISNAQFYTPLLFEWFLGAEPGDLGFLPELTVLSYRLGEAKPSLRLFEQAARALGKHGVQPSATLYVGNDLLNDVYPARQVGFQTVLFAGDERSLRLREGDPRCDGLHPDMVVTNLNQIIRLMINK
jgi:putative hydrolase of the HAD superfamily